ncbi:MAG: bifunctional DNA-formamidopyrimidine glycosylase/DNA-(apurinic or apyrimidinic site) lyase [Alphaproteobacteria bacterium]
MPELPEVETVCRSLRPHILGRKIRHVEVIEPRLRARVDEGALAQVIGRTIVAIGRKGKYILIRLDEGWVWVFHLGMSGKLICVASNSARRKHDHIVVHLSRGSEFRYHDPRRFGLSLVTTAQDLKDLAPLRHLGVDSLDGDLTGDYLFRYTRASQRRIRDLLLDQHIIAGLGNIYANEVLFLTGVKPTVRSCRLTRNQVRLMARAIPQLLREAIRWCGTSFSDYRDADDKRGAFQDHLRVYDRQGEACRVCSSTIKRVALGNRSAYYCPSCQK